MSKVDEFMDRLIVRYGHHASFREVREFLEELEREAQPRYVMATLPSEDPT